MTKIVAVVTAPDKPRGRKLKKKETAVAKYVHEENKPSQKPKIPILKPQNLGSKFIEMLTKIPGDTGIIVAYQKLIPQEVIELFPRGIFNVHYSLLPKYPGPAPVVWALLNNEQETGVSVIKINERYDEGEIVAQKKVKISDDETQTRLTKKCNEAGLELLKNTLRGLKSRRLKSATPQNKKDLEIGKKTYARKLTREDGLVNWEDFVSAIEGDVNRAVKIERMVRALSPWPGVYTKFKVQSSKFKVIEKRLKILEARLVGGRLKPTKVQLEGKRVVGWEEFDRIARKTLN